MNEADVFKQAAEELEKYQPLHGPRLAGYLMVMQMWADQTGQPRPVEGHPSEWATKKGWVSA